MDGSEMKVWVDASSVGTRSEWERVEDACWLCPTEDAKHINLAEKFRLQIIRRSAVGPFKL